MNYFKKLFLNFGELTRAYALPVSLASCLVIWAFAHYYETFNYINFAILIVGICCVHLGANLYDDFADVKNKLKSAGALENISFERFTKKANLILNKTFSFKEVIFTFLFLFTIAALIGAYFMYLVGTLLGGALILFFILAGLILTLFYPIAPKFYLGEVVIGLIYGPLVINGGYFALTGMLSYSVFICSLAIFFSTLVLLHADNIMDWEFDIKENNKTLAILSGSKPRAIKWLMAIIACAYIIITLGVIFGNFLNPYSLLVFLTLPIATKLLKSLDDYINIKDVKFVPRWYYGVFENWKKIQENHIDFFMYRMYLARNFLFFFALFLAIGTVVARG